MSGGWYDPDSASQFHSGYGSLGALDCASTTPVLQKSITPEMFRAFFDGDPVMKLKSDAVIQVQLDAAVSQFNVARWGSSYNLGQYYFIAHQLTMQTIAAKGAIIDTTTSKSAGGLSKGISADLVSKQAANPFLRTIYGQEYMRLRDQLGSGIMAV